MPQDQTGTPCPHESSNVQTTGQDPCPRAQCCRNSNIKAEGKGKVRKARPPTWTSRESSEGRRQKGVAGLLRSLIPGVPANCCETVVSS